jgi:hypothetical protein
MPKAKPVVPMDPAKKAAMLQKRIATKEQKAAATEKQRKSAAALQRWYSGAYASPYTGNTSGQGKKGKSKRRS